MSTDGKTLLMTDFGREILACMLLCCKDCPAKILPLLVAGKADVLNA